MPLTLDHFFVLTEPGAPQAERLVDLGMPEGSPNDHPGQGTANRRFFLRDAMLELLYLRDEQEALNGAGSGLRFAERATPGASPFGLIVTSPPAHEPPFAGWRYEPDYFMGERHFHVADNSDDVREPLCVFVPFDVTPPQHEPRPGEPFATLSRLRIALPAASLSPALEAVARCERIEFELNTPHRMDILFGPGRSGMCRDLRPGLPLIIRW